MRLDPAFCLCLVVALGSVALIQLFGVAYGANLSAVTAALNASNAEARGPILTALSGILAAAVLISAAVLVVKVVMSK